MPRDTTYEVVLPLGDKVEIGDKSSVDFKPHIKLNRWDGECFIAVKPANLVEEEIEYEVDEDKVKCKYKVKYEDGTEEEFEAEFYPLEPRTVIAKDRDGKDVEFRQCELGGFEFEVILKKKPKTNKIVLDIETQGLKFHYQPELAPEEIAEGCVRPDNVVGSYAVYHATRTSMHTSKADADKYKAGKAFHIYRPKITDAEGNWVWGELSLDEKAGTLTTTIPQDFLDSAIYPVSTGTSNFGYETPGSSIFWRNSDILRGPLFTCPSAGTANSLTFSCIEDVSGTLNAKGVIVLHSNLNILTNGVGDPVVVGSSKAWKTSSFSVSPSVAADTGYVLMALCDVGQSNFGMYYDAGDEDQGHDDPTNDYATPTNPTDANHETKKYSVYCTYTPAAGETYEESCSDGIKVGDTPATQCVFGVSVTDGLKSGDAPASIGTFGAVTSDGLKVGDLPSLFLTIPCVASDGVKLGEVLATLLQTYPSLSDGAKLGDAAIAQLVLSLTLSDGVKLGDLPTIAGLIYELSVTDGVKLSDKNILEILRILKLLLKMLAYRSLLIECKAYRDVSVDIRAYRGVELKYRG